MGWSREYERSGAEETGLKLRLVGEGNGGTNS